MDRVVRARRRGGHKTQSPCGTRSRAAGVEVSVTCVTRVSAPLAGPVFCHEASRSAEGFRVRPPGERKEAETVSGTTWRTGHRRALK